MNRTECNTGCICQREVTSQLRHIIDTHSKYSTSNPTICKFCEYSSLHGSSLNKHLCSSHKRVHHIYIMSKCLELLSWLRCPYICYSERYCKTREKCLKSTRNSSDISIHQYLCLIGIFCFDREYILIQC